MPDYVRLYNNLVTYAPIKTNWRGRLEFRAGSGVTLTPTEDPGVGIILEIASTGGSGTPASTVVSETSYGLSAAVGTGTDYARNDHTHGSPALSTATPQPLGVAAPGSGTTPSKNDHVHAMPSASDVSAVPSSYLDTDGTLAANSDVKVATQKATKTYADTKVGGSTGATDNRVLRADGTGGKTAQSSAVTIDDTGIVTGGIWQGSITESGSPANLTVGSIPDGYYVRRSGTTLVGDNPHNAVDSQTISSDTTLTTQRDLLDVTAACAITLPALSTWTVGRVTRIVYRGTSAVTVELVPNAADKIEGSSRIGLYGHDIVVDLLPYEANKFVIRVHRGVAAWIHASYDLTAASGASPWTIGGSVFTDISTASSSIAVSSGLVFTAKNSSVHMSSGTSDCALLRTPLTGIVDGWSRPLKTSDTFWLLLKSSKTTVVGGSSPNVSFNLGGSNTTSDPRIGVMNSADAGNLQYRAFDSSARTVDLAEASVTAANWLGFLWGGNKRRMDDAMLSTSPSGSPGAASGWWPWTYSNTNGYAVGQDYWGGAWVMSNLTDIQIAQTNSTTGSKFTMTAMSVLRVVYGADQ